MRCRYRNPEVWCDHYIFTKMKMVEIHCEALRETQPEDYMRIYNLKVSWFDIHREEEKQTRGWKIFCRSMSLGMFMRQFLGFLGSILTKPRTWCTCILSMLVRTWSSCFFWTSFLSSLCFLFLTLFLTQVSPTCRRAAWAQPTNTQTTCTAVFRLSF